MMRQNKNLMDINIDALYNILKQNQGDVNDAMGLKKKTVVVTSDPLALIAEKTKSGDKKEDKKVEEKKKDMSKVKCYNCKKEDEDHAWMESSSDLDQEINANMVFVAQIKKVLSVLEASSSSSDDKIAEMIKEFDKKIAKYQTRLEKANQQCNDFENQNKDLKDKFDVLKNQATTFEEKKNELNEQIKVLIEKNADLLAQTNVLKEKLKVKHVVIDNHAECQEKYAKLKAESEFACNNARNAFCNSYDVDVNDLFVFDDIVQICLWIINPGCSKHMTGNHALWTNFMEKFLGTVRYGNNDFAVIAGNGDVVIGSMMIKKVYYVKDLGHNLFSVGKFCDKGLEVAFRKSTCFVRNEDGVDLLTGDRSLNLYTIALYEVASNSLTCLLAKASSSQSWLWHQRLSYLNFATINNLMKNNLVQGLPKMKFEKDLLCFACEQGKIHR
nr:integrase, catalytic region, zinc finger, CCHC-type, peptidase aspartic, catalytic [Tanacetum cinerariifolium]